MKGNASARRCADAVVAAVLCGDSFLSSEDLKNNMSYRVRRFLRGFVLQKLAPAVLNVDTLPLAQGFDRRSITRIFYGFSVARIKIKCQTIRCTSPISYAMPYFHTSSTRTP